MSLFILPLKFFDKNKKKLVEEKDYFLLDGTDSDDGDLHKFTNHINLEGIAPPPKLVKAQSKSGDDFEVAMSVFKIEEIEDKYFNSKEFKVAMLTTVKALVGSEGDMNVFVVMSNKAYKIYGEKIAKRINKVFDIGFNFCFTKKDLKDGDKLNTAKLAEELSPKRAELIQHALEKKEKKLEKD